MLNRILLLLIRAYRKWISPLHRPCCRFVPTCSTYALQAVQRYGAMKGGIMAAKRVCRCHPFYKGDLYDPVPTVPKPTGKRKTGVVSVE